MEERLSTTDDSARSRAEALLRPAAAYSERLKAAGREISELEGRSAVLANLRGAVFALAVGLGALALFGKHSTVAWYAVGLLIVVYLALAAAHDRVLRRQQRFRILVDLNERGLARLAGQWHRFADRGDAFPQPDHLYAEDLDIFGQGSLFQFINETATRRGEAVLANWLAAPATAGVLQQRHGAVRELAGLIDFRQRPVLECRMVTQDKADPRAFVAWAEGGPYLRSIAWARPVGWLTPAITLGLFVLGQLGWIAPYAWLIGILLAVVTSRFIQSTVEDFYGRMSVGEMGFVRFERAFEGIEAQRFNDPLL